MVKKVKNRDLKKLCAQIDSQGEAELYNFVNRIKNYNTDLFLQNIIQQDLKQVTN